MQTARIMVILWALLLPACQDASAVWKRSQEGIQHRLMATGLENPDQTLIMSCTQDYGNWALELDLGTALPMEEGTVRKSTASIHMGTEARPETMRLTWFYQGSGRFSLAQNDLRYLTPIMKSENGKQVEFKISDPAETTAVFTLNGFRKKLRPLTQTRNCGKPE